ncbi:dimethylaniline monooxygenase (N-oxide forming) [Pestalotiopsis sp. NC0098]|nr:dimethylaniline monooxygenase (N-oxide forming) [Pestalotiopsis sp. NC0098]
MGELGQQASQTSLRTLSDERLEPGSINILPAKYPGSIATGDSSPHDAATIIIDEFNKTLAAKDYSSLSNLFTDQSYWRDHLCLTWDLRTLHGPVKILDVIQNECRVTEVSLDSALPHTVPQTSPIDVAGKFNTIHFFILISTTIGKGRGFVRLTQLNGEWKILTLFTTLKSLYDVDEPRGSHRPYGKERGTSKNWLEKRNAEKNFEDDEPAVLIIGSGQAGLTASARLKMLGVKSLMIDRNERVGDNWRKRYHSLVLHDPVWFDHLPYLHFPDTWPIFTPKDKIADFFEAYVSLLELNVWTKTEMLSSSWDDSAKRWTVTLERQLGDKKETRTFHPRHIVQATGHSGMINFPTIKGMENFQGRLCHSSQFDGAIPNSHGKRAVVIGSCNSGHDIAEDFYKSGYDVTMVQRSSTCVVSSEVIVQTSLHPLFSEQGPPVEDADIIMWGQPTAYHKSQAQELAVIHNEKDKEKILGLQKAGFAVDMGPDRAGLIYKYYQRGGGYYIDVGASQLIIDGKIAIKHGQEIEEILADGVKFADGSILPADEVVFATGYQNMRTQARLIFGDQVADKLKDVWGFDEEGEFRAMWRNSGHPGLWYMGGNLPLCRYFSQCLALQIKAYETGLISY